MKKAALTILSSLLLFQTLPAHAATVTADAGATNCDQEVDNSSSVVAYRLSTGFCVVEFRRTGSTTWTVPTGVTSISYLVVAGGGGGAGGQASEHGGGGGGAGGVLTGTLSVSAGTINLSVGGGGAGGLANTAGASGTNTVLAGSITAIGGGRGGTYFSPNAPFTGGSGGGAGVSEVVAQLTGANGTAGQGNKGGNVTITGTNARHGAGGGGAGFVGGNVTTSGGFTITAGAGGDGLLSTITGSDRIFGGGGGGGGSSARGGSATGGAIGGSGGGGAGSTYTGSSSTAAVSGTANTGGGGGGGVGIGGANATVGASGGSGIVIIRYALAPAIILAPVISGTASYGETLTATSGNWSNTPISYSYQWSRASTSSGTYTSISGATGSTYNLVTADVDQFLRVTVTASNTGGSLASTTPATAAIARTVRTATLSIEAGSLVYRQPKTLTSTATVAGKITFKVNNKNLPGCVSRNVSSTNSFTVTCVYRPSNRGHVLITSTLVPTDLSFIGATTSSERLFVANRSGNR